MFPRKSRNQEGRLEAAVGHPALSKGIQQREEAASGSERLPKVELRPLVVMAQGLTW